MLLRELLDCHLIKSPKEVDEYLDIEIDGKEAHIYSELQLINSKLDLIVDLATRLNFK